MAENRIYLDWNATAPLRPEAGAAAAEALALCGNPSSVHAEGRAASLSGHEAGRSPREGPEAPKTGSVRLRPGSRQPGCAGAVACASR